MSIFVPNKYIVFEGTDGSGKTTLSSMIADLIPNDKVVTKEPGSPHVQLCVDIREEILNHAGLHIDRDPEFYAYLFAADTKLHMERVVKPALNAGKWVVSDRSVMSDYAYRPQHGGDIRHANLLNFMRQFPVVFFIDADPEVCGERMQDRGDLNEFEKKHVLGKIDKIRNGYVNSKEQFEETANDIAAPARWYTVDNNGPIEIAFKQIVGLLAYNFPEFTDVIDVVKVGGLI